MAEPLGFAIFFETEARTLFRRLSSTVGTPPLGGALFTRTTVRDTIKVWIVDVERTRLFLGAVTTTEADLELKQEIQQILGSIRFE